MQKPGSPSVPPNRMLSAREAAAFKELLILFENKLFKKALKQADQILKTKPEHGETLAVKGLVIANLQPTAPQDSLDPLDLIKRGIKNDIGSFICWQILGLYYRLKKNYQETLQAYKRALKIDPINVSMLKDAALLQAQERQYNALVETRSTLIQLEPPCGPMWRALSIALALASNASSALQALEKALKDKHEVISPPAFSELMRYKWKLEHLSALPTTAQEATNVVDKDVQDEALAQYSSDLVLAQEASSRRRSRNPDLPGNVDTKQHTADFSNVDFLECGRIMDKSIEKKDFQLFSAVFNHLFEAIVDKTPISLFNMVRMAIGQNELIEIIMERKDENPESLPRCTFFACILDHLGLHQRSVDILALPISQVELPGDIPETEPVSVSLSDSDKTLFADALTVRSKALKHLKLFELAANDAVLAARLCPTDRSLNAMAVRRLLSADNLDAAEKFFSTCFVGTQVDNSHEMQMAWWEIRAGEAYWRARNFEKAIGCWRWVIETFFLSTMTDDVFDFHSYALRRCSFIGYLDLLRCTPPSPMPRFFKHVIWQRAACNLLYAFLSLRTFEQASESLRSQLLPLVESIVPVLSHYKNEGAPKLVIRKQALLSLYLNTDYEHTTTVVPPKLSSYHTAVSNALATSLTESLSLLSP